MVVEHDGHPALCECSGSCAGHKTMAHMIHPVSLHESRCSLYSITHRFVRSCSRIRSIERRISVFVSDLPDMNKKHWRCSLFTLGDDQR